MKLSLIIMTSNFISLAQGSRYGLLRVGSSVNQEESSIAPSHTSKSLFDEDFSHAFRQLFGTHAGLSLSIGSGAAQLSFSMMQIGGANQLSMGALAPLSLSMIDAAAEMRFGAAFGSEGTILHHDSQTKPQEPLVAASTNESRDIPSSSSSSSNPAHDGSVATTPGTTDEGSSSTAPGTSINARRKRAILVAAVSVVAVGVVVVVAVLAVAPALRTLSSPSGGTSVSSAPMIVV